ncbi:hypothetical protein [Enterobacter huaxiensis]|uniref:hypothetical protein n=1 Tax=Enterobacter huaxiensis TaxID=2494702 RepID=UPI0021D81ADB|nr:hypothetical protein [Enterobacter huaxiensis]
MVTVVLACKLLMAITVLSPGLTGTSRDPARMLPGKVVVAAVHWLSAYAVVAVDIAIAEASSTDQTEILLIFSPSILLMLHLNAAIGFSHAMSLIFRHGNQILF